MNKGIPDSFEDVIDGYCKERDSNHLKLMGLCRHNGVWCDFYKSVMPKDELILADLIIQSSTGNLAVRATYKVPPYAAPYIFYVGNDKDEVAKAFKRLFALTLEEVEQLNLKQDWNFPV